MIEITLGYAGCSLVAVLQTPMGSQSVCAPPHLRGGQPPPHLRGGKREAEEAEALKVKKQKTMGEARKVKTTIEFMC